MSIPELEVLRTEVETRLNTGNFVDLFAKVNKLPFCKGIEAYKVAFTSNNLPNGLLIFQQQVGLFLYACIDGEIARLQAVERATQTQQSRLQTQNSPASQNEEEAKKWCRMGVDATDLEAQISAYSPAIALKPDYADAYYNRGIAKQSLGKYKEAIEDYTKAIDLKSDDAEAYNNRGWAKDELGKYQEAIEDYNKSIELKNPLLHLPYNNRGLAKYMQDKYQEAIEDFNKTIALKPDFAGAFWNRALAYAYLKDKPQTLTSLREAIRLDSQYKERTKTASIFNLLRGNKDFEALLK